MPKLGEQHLDFWLKRLESPSFVYVIQGDPGTPIKVGVAKDVPARIRGLQTGNPQKLRLLHVVPGAGPLERSLHLRLKDSKVLGEWFGEPGIDEFLGWVGDYATRAIANFLQDGRLPAAPPIQKGHRRGLKSDKLGHRWRTSSGERAAPVIVRFVEPSPVTPQEQAERERQRELERVLGNPTGIHPLARRRISPSPGFGN